VVTYANTEGTFVKRDSVETTNIYFNGNENYSSKITDWSLVQSQQGSPNKFRILLQKVCVHACMMKLENMTDLESVGCNDLASSSLAVGTIYTLCY
jgi:hypothetical protein